MFFWIAALAVGFFTRVIAFWSPVAAGLPVAASFGICLAGFGMRVVLAIVVLV